MPLPGGGCKHPPIPHTGGSNWIEKLPVPLNSLPQEAECVARALFWDRGKSKEVAYRMAIGITENWASGKGNVSAPVRARAVAAVAKWKAMRAAAHAKSGAKKA